MFPILAAASDSGILVGGGSLLGVTIMFTLALMRQARRQYIDASQKAERVETNAATAAAALRVELNHQLELAETAARTRYESLHQALERCEANERVMNRKVDTLIVILHQNGVPIPAEIWSDGA